MKPAFSSCATVLWFIALFFMPAALRTYGQDDGLSPGSTAGLPAKGNTCIPNIAAEERSRAIRSGEANLLIKPEGGTYGVAFDLTNSPALYAEAEPLAVEIVPVHGDPYWLAAGYSSVQDMGDGAYRCTGTVSSTNGSAFDFTDVYHAQGDTGMFEVKRSVVVTTANPGDAGFATKLTFQRSIAGAMDDYDFFMPAIWYRDNTNVSRFALASNPGDFYYWYREDRMPLPLFMLRQKDNGVTFSVAHINPDGSTFVGERGRDGITDGRLQFASLGMENNHQPAVGLLFPGSEGERSLIGGRLRQLRWATVYHPVQTGFTQDYNLLMTLSIQPDFVSAMENTWRDYYRIFNPAIYHCNLEEVYSAGIDILTNYWRLINGAPGLPFRIPLDGVITDQHDYNYDMGFVGEQLPNASLLIHKGLNANNTVVRSDGELMADWWANHALTPSGCPRTWYNPYPQTWRTYPTYIRVASDGMIGLLRAWKYEERHGINHTNWLEACTRFGDWLMSKQNDDGSIARVFDYRSNLPIDPSKNNTSHIVRYLVELYMATGSDAYQQAALKAGNFIYTDVCRNFNYVGGTVDNPNVPDKEAASMALRAFLSLYDLTHDPKWRSAAVQTAYYYSTWVYAWNVPVPTNDPDATFPASRQDTGESLIATANSGADSYAATDAFGFYRLYLMTGDEQLLNTAKLLLYNTKQALNWDPANRVPGWGPLGIIPEALTLVVPRGHGVHYYLPWETANYLEPMADLEDAFGSYDLNQIEEQPLARRQRENNLYGKNLGYQRP